MKTGKLMMKISNVLCLLLAAAAGVAAPVKEGVYTAGLATETVGEWDAEKGLPGFAGVWPPGGFAQKRTRKAMRWR